MLSRTNIHVAVMICDLWYSILEKRGKDEKEEEVVLTTVFSLSAKSYAYLFYFCFKVSEYDALGMCFFKVFTTEIQESFF